MRPTPKWWSHLKMGATGEVGSCIFLTLFGSTIAPGPCALTFRRPHAHPQASGLPRFVNFNQQMQVKVKVRRRWRMHEPRPCHTLAILQNLRSADCLSGFSGSKVSSLWLLQICSGLIPLCGAGARRNRHTNETFLPRYTEFGCIQVPVTWPLRSVCSGHALQPGCWAEGEGRARDFGCMFFVNLKTWHVI